MIAAGECHLWPVAVRPRPEWLPLLDGDERARAARLAGAPAADVLVTSRGAQRMIGAHYLGVAPADVVTDRRCEHCPDAPAHGRPRWPGSGLHHSVTHAGGWVLVAVTAGSPVGVDIEDPAAVPDPDAFATAVLSDAEQAAAVARAPVGSADRVRALATAWTRKEAAMKLTGLGLRVPPRLLDVRAPTLPPPAVPGWPAHDVHLRDLDGPAGYVGALACGTQLHTVRRFDLATAAPIG